MLGDNNPLSAVCIEAAVEAGFPRSSTFDEGTLDGFGWNRSSISKGRRNSSYQAFVAPVAGRPNLSVISETVVERLLVDRARRRLGRRDPLVRRGPVAPHRARARSSSVRARSTRRAC